MSGAYSTKKKVEDEKLKKQQAEKSNEKQLAEKKKTKNICDDAEARRNRKKKLEEEKKLKEEQHRQEVLAERRRVQQEYIETFKKNLKEQRKKSKDNSDTSPPLPAPEVDNNGEEEFREVTPTPRIVQGHTVEKLLSDELIELRRKLMDTFPLKENEGEIRELPSISLEKENKEFQESNNGENDDEDLERSRHIRWRDMETSQPIHSSASTASLLNSFASNDDLTSDDVAPDDDDVASVATDDVASLDGITDFGITQKIPKMKRSSSSSSNSSFSSSSSFSFSSSIPSTSTSNSNLSIYSSISTPTSYSSTPSIPTPSIPTPSPSISNNSSSSKSIKSSLKSSSPVPPSSSSSPSLKSKAPVPSSPKSQTTNKLNKIDKEPPVVEAPPSPSPSLSSSSSIPSTTNNITAENNKQFQSRIPRFKQSQKTSSPAVVSPSISDKDIPITTPISPVPIRAQSPELLPKSKPKPKSNPDSELHDSTQLFMYMEELVRRSGVSMEELISLANENGSHENSPTTPTRKKITTGLSMEEDRLLHALRDLEKTGAKQQQAIGKLYKEINEMISRKPPPQTKSAESTPRVRGNSNPKQRPKRPPSPSRGNLQAPQPTLQISQPTTLPSPTLQSVQPTNFPLSMEPQVLVNNYALPAQMANLQGVPLYNFPQTAYMQPAGPIYVQPQYIPTQLPYSAPSSQFVSPQINPPAQYGPILPSQINSQQLQNNLSPTSARKLSQLDPSNNTPTTNPIVASPSKQTPRGISKQSPRSAAHKLQPTKNISPPSFISSSSYVEPSPPISPQKSISPLPPHPSSLKSPPQVSRRAPSPSPSLSSFQPSPSLSSYQISPSLQASPPAYSRTQSASTPPRSAPESNNLENSTTPRTGGYAKKTRPMFAKPVEVLASPLQAPIGSPSATPRKAVEPSSFHKWKNVFGSPAEPNTSRSHRSFSPSPEINNNNNGQIADLQNKEFDYSSLGEAEADREMKEMSETDGDGMDEGENQEDNEATINIENRDNNYSNNDKNNNEHDSEGDYYEGDQFESYSSGEEEIVDGRDSVLSIAIDRPKQFNPNYTNEGKIVMSDHATRLLFG